MNKIGILIIGAMATALGLAGCSKSTTEVPGTGTTTFSVSGTMGGLSLMNTAESSMSLADYAQYYAATAVELVSNPGYGENRSSAATACSDGKFYRVLCSSWSTPPVSAYGDVSCASGASTGAFTVAGLPVGSDISCFVRVSTDNSTFKPFATLEVTAPVVGGKTDTLTPTTNVILAVTVANGAVSTAITSGATAPSTSTPVVAANFNGFWGISCDGADAAENIRCKCMMGHNNSAYPTGEDACIADSAAQISAPGTGAPTFGYREVVDMRVYTGAVGAPGLSTDDDATTYEIAAGGSISGISVWGGSCSGASTCTSPRTQTALGDGLPTFGGIITWSNTTALTWSTGVNQACATCGTAGGAASIDLTQNPIPSNSASRADWLAWLVGLVEDSNWTCNMGASSKAPATAKLDGFCLSNFTWQVYQQLKNSTTLVLPIISYRHECSGSDWGGGCTITPNANYMQVEGIEFDNTGAVVTGKSMGKQPMSRFVLEQFIPIGSGGGGFKQGHHYEKWIPCLGGSGTDSTSGMYTCPTGANGIECGIKEEMAIKFIPSTTGVFLGGFSRAQSVYKGTIRGGTYNGSSNVSSPVYSAYAKCLAVVSASGGTFTAKFTKMAN